MKISALSVVNTIETYESLKNKIKKDEKLLYDARLNQLITGEGTEKVKQYSDEFIKHKKEMKNLLSSDIRKVPIYYPKFSNLDVEAWKNDAYYHG